MDTLRARWPYAAVWAVLAVYALLALCAYPALDDWVFAHHGRDQGVLASTATYLAGWGGRWASALLLYGLGLLPDVALCYPVLVLAGFALAAWAVGRAHGWGAALIAGVPLLAWLPVPAEGPYWLSGGITYLLPLLLLALAASLPHNRWGAAARFSIGACAAGCSETACVLGGAALAAACLLHDRRHVWTLVGAFAGGLFAVLAPGNAARWEILAGGHRPDLLGACLSALPRTTLELLGRLAEAWLCPAAPAITALALAATAARRHPPWSSGPIVLAATLGGALLALLASNATVGFIEGRQANAIWLHLVLGGVAAAWILLLPLGQRARLGLLLGWWLLCWAHLAMQPTNGPGALAACAAATAAAAWLGWRAWQARTVAAPAWLALSALAAPGLLVACGDLWLAPQRRAEQWRRDAAVVRLHDAGEKRLRVPLLDPDHFPATISVGDLQPGHWATAGYATWHGLDAVLVDPRVQTVSPLAPPR